MTSRAWSLVIAGGAIMAAVVKLAAAHIDNILRCSLRPLRSWREIVFLSCGSLRGVRSAAGAERHVSAPPRRTFSFSLLISYLPGGIVSEFLTSAAPAEGTQSYIIGLTPNCPS